MNSGLMFRSFTLIDNVFFAISRSRAAQNLPYKEFDLFERSEFSNSRQICAAQGSPPKAGQVNGCPFFWFVFFGKTKKMNWLNKQLDFASGNYLYLFLFKKTNFHSLAAINIITHAVLVMTQKMAISLTQKKLAAININTLPLNPFLNNIGGTPHPGSD